MPTRSAPPEVLPPAVPGFELGECLGRGATSEVWAAMSEADGRGVAVKVVHAELTEVDAAAREAALSAVAATAHVVQVEACLPLEDGRVALVMPWLRGGSLGALVAARGHLAPGEVVTVLAPVASALARLHAVGVVHGDVSPGNVLLDVDGRPHLADLGLGQVLGEESPGVWGSDGYVAPEVVLGARATTAADVYSLGALGWLCLTGAVPGAPGLRPGLLDVALGEPGPGLSALVRTLDSAIDPDAGQRPDADALAWSLFEAATPAPIHLVRGDDEVSAITYRLRAAAGGVQAHDESAAGDRRGSRRPRVGRPGASTALPERVRAAVRRGHRVPRPQRGAHRREVTERRRPGARTLAFGSLGAVLLCVLVVVGLGSASTAGHGVAGTSVADAAPGPATPESFGAAPGREHGSQPGQGHPRAGDPRLDVGAPTTRAHDLVSALANARAAAWRSGTPALLREVDAPGSLAWSRDLAGLLELKRSGIRYTDLQYDVARVSVVSSAGDKAVVRARIGTSAYVVVSLKSREARPATTGAPVLLSLVRTRAGWRVSDVRADVP